MNGKLLLNMHSGCGGALNIWLFWLFLSSESNQRRQRPKQSGRMLKR